MKQKPYEELTFTDGFMFEKIMTNYPDICRDVTGMLLGKKIREIKFLEYEKTEVSAYGSKAIRMDVYTEDDDTQYDIEMQAAEEPELAKRSRYYHASMDTASLKKGKAYSELKKCYVIFICKQITSKEARAVFDKPVYTFTYTSEEPPHRKLNDGSVTIIVNAGCDDPELPQEMREFLEYIRTGKAAAGEGSITWRIQNMVNKAIETEEWSLDYWRERLVIQDALRHEYPELYEKISETRKELEAVRREVRAAEEEVRAAEEEVRAAEEKARTAQAETKAAQEEARAAQAETKAAQEEARTAQAETKAAQEEARAVKDELAEYKKRFGELQ